MLVRGLTANVSTKVLCPWHVSLLPPYRGVFRICHVNRDRSSSLQCRSLFRVEKRGSIKRNWVRWERKYDLYLKSLSCQLFCGTRILTGCQITGRNNSANITSFLMLFFASRKSCNSMSVWYIFRDKFVLLFYCMEQNPVKLQFVNKYGIFTWTGLSFPTWEGPSCLRRTSSCPTWGETPLVGSSSKARQHQA